MIKWWNWHCRKSRILDCCCYYIRVLIRRIKIQFFLKQILTSKTPKTILKKMDALVTNKFFQIIQWKTTTTTYRNWTDVISQENDRINNNISICEIIRLTTVIFTDFKEKRKRKIHGWMIEWYELISLVHFLKLKFQILKKNI